MPLYSSLLLFALLGLRVPLHLARRRAAAREHGRRAVLGLAYAHAAECRGVPTEAFADAYSEAAERPITTTVLERLLVQLGGDLAIGDDGETNWRFPNLEVELHALAQERSAADAGECDAGTVQFTTGEERT